MPALGRLYPCIPHSTCEQLTLILKKQRPVPDEYINDNSNRPC
jgi:hypothetical protein